MEERSEGRRGERREEVAAVASELPHAGGPALHLRAAGSSPPSALLLPTGARFQPIQAFDADSNQRGFWRI